jgi:P27 family predicted phage terminase small subunit
MSGTSKSGRRPLPTNLKLLKGNPGKRRLNGEEPQPIGDLPSCPKHLVGDARQAWNQFKAGLIGIATALDATALELLCTAYAAYLDAAAKVAESGAVWVEEAEGIKKFTFSPYRKVMDSEWAKVKSMLDEFGMTPSSRTKLRVSAPAGMDEFEKFVSRG